MQQTVDTQLSPTRDEQPPRQRWLGRVDPYLVLAAGLVVWSVAVAVQHTWTTDFLLHVGTVRALSRDLLTPPDPMTGAGSSSPYYSPLIWLLAATVRGTGAAPTAVFGVLAVLNTVLLVWSFRRFCRWFVTSAGGAAVALLATLFLWGIRPPVWSGFLSLRSLAEVVAYPSTTAFGLMLLALDRLLHHRRHRDLTSLVTFGLLGATITLIHSFTAVNTAVGALAVLLCAGPRWRAADLLRVALVAAGAFLLVAAWPFTTVGELLTGAPEFVEIHRQLRDGMLDPIQLSCAYGLLGLVPLALRLRDQRRDPLVLIFAVAVVALAVGFAGQYHLLRVMPLAMLSLHVAFGAFVAGAVGRFGDEQSVPVIRPAARRALAALAAVVFLAGLAVDVTPLNGFLGAVPVRALPPAAQAQASTPSLSGPSHRYDQISRYVPEGATILTDQRTSDRHLNWLGYFTVNPGWPDPWIGDEKARAADRRRLRTATATPAERGAVAARWDADCVLITATKAVTGPDAVAGYRQVRADRSMTLYCR
ncbi:hypothetical protein [Micromonospora sp. 067-2]|uniref:hypothetical protein n=1 Tax=Micromonospora sp. 067-2 TaxID=2789270 RepID=UPI003979B119